MVNTKYPVILLQNVRPQSIVLYLPLSPYIFFYLLSFFSIFNP